MDFLELLKNMAPYIVSIAGSIITYRQAKKKLNQELEIAKANNQHEIKRLVKEHKINIEAKEKAYEHEKEILELRSKTSIHEKNQEVMNAAMSNVIVDVFNKIMTGEMDLDKVDNMAKRFSENKD